MAGLEDAALAQLQPASACERVLSSPELLRLLFGALPPDTRLRCREVCTLWRRLLDSPAAWAELDFSEATHALDEALLMAAAVRAAGGLRSLVIGQSVTTLWDEACFPEAEVGPALLQVLRDNAASLRRFNALGKSGAAPDPDFEPLLCTQLAAILDAAPALETLEAHATSFDADSLTAVLQRPGVAILRLYLQHDAEDLDERRVRELAAAIACQQRMLQRCELLYVPLDDAPTALVDAFLACPLLTDLDLRCTTVTPDALAALARLLAADRLSRFSFTECTPSADLWESREAPMAFAASLRAARRLTDLSLDGIWLLETRGAVGAEAAILASLVGHPSLASLNVGTSSTRASATSAPAMLGAWLGAVVAANAPALARFSFAIAPVSDADALPFFVCLPFNTHLRWIVIFSHNLSLDFMRDVALPAIRTNTSLRHASVPQYCRQREANDPRTVALKEIDAQICAALEGRGELNLW
jgi:hypothetical protein